MNSSKRKLIPLVERKKTKTVENKCKLNCCLFIDRELDSTEKIRQKTKQQSNKRSKKNRENQKKMSCFLISSYLCKSETLRMSCPQCPTLWISTTVSTSQPLKEKNIFKFDIFLKRKGFVYSLPRICLTVFNRTQWCVVTFFFISSG